MEITEEVRAAASKVLCRRAGVDWIEAVVLAYAATPTEALRRQRTATLEVVRSLEHADGDQGRRRRRCRQHRLRVHNNVYSELTVALLVRGELDAGPVSTAHALARQLLAGPDLPVRVVVSCRLGCETGEGQYDAAYGEPGEVAVQPYSGEGEVWIRGVDPDLFEHLDGETADEERRLAGVPVDGDDDQEETEEP